MKGIAYKGDGKNLCSFCNKKSKGSTVRKEGVIDYCGQEHVFDEKNPRLGLEPNIKPKSDYWIIDSNIQLSKD